MTKKLAVIMIVCFLSLCVFSINHPTMAEKWVLDDDGYCVDQNCFKGWIGKIGENIDPETKIIWVKAT